MNSHDGTGAIKAAMTYIRFTSGEGKTEGGRTGIGILEISTIVGYSDSLITINVYGGLFPNSTERAMEILDNCKAIVPVQLKTKTEPIKKPIDAKPILSLPLYQPLNNKGLFNFAKADGMCIYTH